MEVEGKTVRREQKGSIVHQTFCVGGGVCDLGLSGKPYWIFLQVLIKINIDLYLCYFRIENFFMVGL